MAVREFTDSEGVIWRAWEVTAEQLRPVTSLEDLVDLASGWLTFESFREKRRLPLPFPGNWDVLPLPELEALCRRATPVTRRSRNSGETRAVGEVPARVAAVETAAGTGEERSFLSPRGREWVVRLHECLDRDQRHHLVLRFTADDVVVDLADWPEGWQRLDTAEFALLLLDANPPRLADGAGPQRRRSDRPER